MQEPGIMSKNKHSDGLALLSLIVGHKASGLDFISSHFARSYYEYGTSSVKHKPFRMKDTLRCKNDITTKRNGQQIAIAEVKGRPNDN